LIKADLHIHTIGSDGSEKAQTVVVAAKDARLDMISITDHDAISSIKNAMTIGDELGIPVIPGIEFSAAHRGEMHILGYFTDVNNAQLKEKTQALAKARVQRMQVYIEKIQADGIAILLDDVRAQSKGDILSRAHIADALVAKGIVSDRNEAFDRYLRKLPQSEVLKFKSPKKACIDWIHEAGGMAVLAHPVYNLDDDFEDVLDELIMFGLNGLEVYHPDHTDEHAKYFEELAKKKALLVTSGSDYHGLPKPEIVIGSETRTSDYHQHCMKIFKEKIITRL